MSGARLRLYLVGGAGGSGLISAVASAILVPGGHGLAVGLAWVALGVVPVFVVAVWLVGLRPEHIQARRLLLMASAWAATSGLEGPTRAAFRHYGGGVWLLLVNTGYQYANLLTTIAATMLIAAYPDGVVERAWQRTALRVVWWQLALPPLVLLCVPSVTVAGYLVPGMESAVSNPFAVAAPAAIVSAAQTLVSGLYGAGLGMAVLFSRYLRLRAADRPAMPLLVYLIVTGLGLTIVDNVLATLGLPRSSAWRGATSSIVLVILFLIPVSLVWGVLRRRLFDIDVVVRRSVVYGALSLTIAALYAMVAVAPGLALGGQVPVQAAVVVTVLAALAFQPARRRLERLADRLVFGERVNRYQLLSSFGLALERSVDLGDLLPQLATTVRTGLGAQWVRVSLQGERDGSWLESPLGLAGAVSGPVTVVQELRQGDQSLGRIECGPKPDGYDQADLQLLANLAVQSATAIANVALTAQLTERLEELSRSRARIIAAQDAERRRIERNIHDGVQQEVVVLITKLRLARNKLGRGELRDSDFADLQEDARELLTSLRELALGIHPPVLSDNGLVAAVEARVTRLPLDVTVVADEALRTRRLGEELEGAAYFVICEALTNVVKHAAATTTSIELTSRHGQLSLEVRDDGRGTNGDGGRGNGLTNLRDRIEALGGQLSIDSPESGGTRLRAALPIQDRHG